MKNPPKMLNRAGAARLLNRSEVTIAKHVEKGIIKCAWVFSDEEGLLIRRPEGENTKRLNFFQDEIIQYLERQGDGTYEPNFRTEIVLNDNRSNIYNTKGASKVLGITTVRLITLFQEGRIAAYGYDEDGVLVPRDPQSRSIGQVTIYFEEDLAQFERLPHARPEVEPKTKQQAYLKEYYQKNKEKWKANKARREKETDETNEAN